MKIYIKDDERGLGHVLLILLIVVVVGVVGFVGWKVYSKKSGDIADTIASKQAAAECNKEMDDKDLCKFLSSWEQSKQYRIVSTTKADGETSKSTFEIDGDKSYMKLEGAASYEVITIDKTTYTKAGSTWYKQTTKTQETDVTDDYKVDFDEPSKDESKDSTTYKSQGKEACGDLQCFKYEVVDPNDKSTTQYIWFDDKDYKLRKTVVEDKDSSVESVFEYDNVSISEPSPVKELSENQYIMPGSDEVMTVPSY